LLSLGEEYPGLILALTEALQELGWITFLCSASPLPVEMLSKANIYPVEIPPPDVEGQIALWKMHLESIAAELNAMDLSQLVSQFNLTGGQILNAIKRAEKIAHVRDPYRTRLDIQDLSSSSRTESQPRLTALARKVEPRYGWQDLVLPESHMSQLHEIASQAKHRHRVMRDWGFGKKMALGRGLNALFAGSSGTGKTMAAEVIGYELGLDIYKIDLSAVVSKYIGETEKNLNRLFNEAEHSNAILFFDEADALFGKRSEVKDAHDRYANIEVGFLLQKMEEYEGITILSSNLRRNIDEAFVRRIQFIIDFPFPDATHREMIWRKTFPEKAPLDADVDFTFLATKFKLTGGHIRNIGLRSSYYAAEANGAITMAHVVRATKRELQKMGKLYTEAEFGDYGEAQD
jgi:ATP-dependent 26S proteasome regulatory subunit